MVTYAGGKDAEIPVGTTSVRKGAFMGKTNIVSVEFPKNGLTSLGDYTFSGCTSLKKAAIPSSVTYTGTGCFASCYSLEDVLFSLNCTIFSEKFYCFVHISIGFGKGFFTVHHTCAGHFS